jgi:phosphate transport system substrate-binding protein
MTTRPLTNEEKAYCQQRNVNPREFKYATSALAFVKNLKATDTTYVYEELLRQMRDETTGTLFVLENAKSGIANELLTLMNTDTLPGHFYAFPTKEEVLDYVDEHDKAIGVIDYGDISDSDSAYTREVLARIQLLAISRPADSTQVGFVRPFQYNLQDRKYPFTRDLYYISQSGKTDVGIGFASFICGEIGQKIILKAGLLPAYQTERTLEINYTEDIKVIQ